MTNTLPNQAKVMIGMVAAASLYPLSLGVINWQMPTWPQLALLMMAAVLTSRLKVKLPGMTSTMSGNLPVILLSITQLGLSASLLLAVTAAIAQCYASGKAIKPVQLLFNACTLINASALAYLVYHSHLLAAYSHGALSLVAAAAAYFLANTAPVAGIIGLTESNSPFGVWHKVFLWSFPNYLIGAGLTALASLFSTAAGFATLGALTIISFGVYRSYKMFVEHTEQVAPRALAMAAGR